jgi:hypothetical protein
LMETGDRRIKRVWKLELETGRRRWPGDKFSRMKFFRRFGGIFGDNFFGDRDSEMSLGIKFSKIPGIRSQLKWK